MYTIKEVMSVLKVSRLTIFRALTSGKVKGIKIGNVWRISEEELERIKREGF